MKIIDTFPIEVNRQAPLASIETRLSAISAEAHQAKFRHPGDERLWDIAASMQSILRDVERLREDG